MLDKLLAALSMMALILFLGIVIWFVREPDLTLIIVIPVGIAIYAVWTSFREKSNGDNGSPTGS
jgi:hypothetical protein